MSEAAAVPNLEPIVAPFAGALLIGVYFSLCLFGVNSLQAWYYYQHYPTDSVFLKGTVATIWIFELSHAIFECHAIYFYLVQGFGNILDLDVTIWSATMTLGVTATLTLIVHSFFAWRVYILSSKNKVVPAIIIGFAIIGAGMTWVVVGQSFAAGRYSKFPHSIKITSTTSLAFAVATDFMIAGSLGFFLHSRRSGILKTERIINKLIFWAVNIGILTSLTDLVVLITSELIDNLIFLAVYQVISNLYAASVLATLNLRPFTRQNVLNEHGTVVELSSGSFKAVQVGSNSNKTNTFISQRSIATMKSDSETKYLGRKLDISVNSHHHSAFE